jgi:hypothetical protein
MHWSAISSEPREHYESSPSRQAFVAGLVRHQNQGIQPESWNIHRLPQRKSAGAHVSLVSTRRRVALTNIFLYSKYQRNGANRVPKLVDATGAKLNRYIGC